MDFLNSRQKHFYLPEPQTDFIFSIISEEFGFMGVVIVSTLFLIIIIRGLKIAKNIKRTICKVFSIWYCIWTIISSTFKFNGCNRINSCYRGCTSWYSITTDTFKPL